jgi:Reverse transcriptase (RNA-dependent DNA polymerase)
MWYMKFDDFLIKQKFNRLHSDHSVYIHRTNTSLTIIGIHVDDTIILSNSLKELMEIKTALSSAFEMTDCGELHYYLGIQVRRDRKNRQITLSQQSFAEQVLRRFGMQDANPVATPLDVSAKLVPATDDERPTAADITHYQQIVGSLMYLMLGTRPDLAATISIIGKFASKPTHDHLRLLSGFYGT